MRSVRLVPVLLTALFALAGCLDAAPAPGEGTDEETVPAPATGDLYPAWGGPEAPLRPGASLGGYCTFNFLYEGPNGTGYVGTAGHCTEEVGERVELAGVGVVGTVVYDSDLAQHGSDFSLILLDDPSQAHPGMLSWDGPTGVINATELAVGDRIRLHGYGVLLGDLDQTRAREGVLVSWTEDEYDVDMPAVNGDSGSPLLHEDGRAFGIVSRYGFADGVPSTDSGPLMSFIFAGLAEAGYGDVRLATV